MHSINFICQKGHMGEVFWGEEERGEDCSNSFFLKYYSNSFKYNDEHYH